MAAGFPPSLFLSEAQAGPQLRLGEHSGPSGQELVIFVGHIGRASQLHSRTGPDREKTA